MRVNFHFLPDSQGSYSADYLVQYHSCRRDWIGRWFDSLTIRSLQLAHRMTHTVKKPNQIGVRMPPSKYVLHIPRTRSPLYLCGNKENNPPFSIFLNTLRVGLVLF